MKRSKFFPLIFFLLPGIAIILVGVLLATFDVNRYRPEIGAALSERLGREVTLRGPITWGFSPTSGIDVSVKDIILANPAGPGRPDMARIARLSLAVAFLPLLGHKLDIKALDAADVNVYLDTAAITFANGARAKPPTSSSSAHKGKPLGFSVSKTSIENANLVIEGKNGKTATYQISSLTLTAKGSEMELLAKGSFNGAPLNLEVRGPRGIERLRQDLWPFTGKARYGGFTVKANGTLDLRGKKIELAAITLAAGGTKVAAQLAISYGSARPVVRGTISGDNLDPKDLARALPEEARKVFSPKTEALGGRAGEKGILSRAPISLEGLRAADGHLVVALGDLHVGKASCKQFQATVDLNEGRLLLSPVNTRLAGGSIEGRVEFDGQKSPARVRAVIHARQVDLEQLASLGGFHSLFEGKSDIDYDLASEGESPHDFARNVRGRINIAMGGGTVKARVIANTATALLSALIPGASGREEARVNCLAARFTVVGERMQSSGILLDTGAVTAMGTGDVDLGHNTIDMVVNSRPKVPIVGSFTPALRISGSLANPHFSVDTGSYLYRAEGFIEGQRGFSGVPAVSKGEGQNACVSALDHPQEAWTSPLPGAGSVNKALNRAGGSINRLGGKILHGIGGAFGK
ncbi:MAG: AsmA family protein [Syntrophobacteraceae bacterium]|nr:AsmA family protein [Syntrophobacteraceae bacterium]